MPTPPAPQITAWSWSRLLDYSKCPALCNYKHVSTKWKAWLKSQPEGDALTKGSAAHKDCENYMTRKPESTITPAMTTFRAEFQDLRKRLKPSQLQTELQVAFNKDWSPVDWFASDAWVRFIFDITWIEATEARREAIDYKTGKNREEAHPQLRLGNLLSFFMSPKIKVAHSAFWFLDLGEAHEEMLLEGDVEKERSAWLKRVKPMLSDRVFMPKPGNHCRWCNFSKNRQGPCPY